MRLLATLALLTSLLCACQRDPAGGGSQDLDAGICTRDLERIAALERCRTDDHCPCGSACVLGQCRAECLRTSDCASEERCDAFGRCRPAGDDSVVAPLRTATESNFQVLPSHLQPSSATLHLTVRATEGELGTVRVAADAGLEVRCVAEGDFGAECTLPGIAAKASAKIAVRASSEIEAGEVRLVRVFSGARVRSVSYGDAIPLTPQAAEEVEEPSGLYVGRAQLVEAGQRLVPTNDAGLPPTAGVPVAGFELPLKAELHRAPAGAEGVKWLLVLQDELGMLHPEGKLTAGLVDDGNDQEVYVASHDLLPVELRTEAPLAERFRAVRARYVFHSLTPYAPVAAVPRVASSALERGRFGFDLISAYDVLPRPELAPKLRWRIQLARVGDLPAGAAPPGFSLGSATAFPAVSQAQVDVPSSWSEALRTRLAAPAQAERAEATYRRSDSDPRACAGLRDPEHEAFVAAHAQLRNWFGSTAADGSLTFGYQAFQPRVSFWLDWANRPFDRVGALLRPLLEDIASHVEGSEHRVTTADLQSFVAPSTPGGEAFSPRDLPCAVSLEPFFVTGGDYHRDYDDLAIDVCDQMAAEYGCEIVAENIYFYTYVNALTVGWEVNESTSTDREFFVVRPTGAGFETSLQGGTTRVCRLPATPAACVEALQCHTPLPGDGYFSSVLGGDFDTASGDARCVDTARTLGLSADQNPTALGARAMLEACLSDLERLLDAPPVGVSLDQLQAGAGCFEAARTLAALEAAGTPLRQVGTYFTSPPLESAALFQRLVTRWVDLLGFLTKESLEAEKLARVVRRDPRGERPPVAAEEVLRTALRGWQLVYHPKTMAALAALSGTALALPDYRHRLGPVSSGLPKDPGLGFPVALLKTLRSQAELAALLVERSQYVRDREALTLAGSTLRAVSVLYPVALELHARAAEACAADAANCDGAAQPPWQPVYLQARAGLETAMTRLAFAAAAARDGQNPLGIAENDLPLYFLGQDASESGRYFAISDYLLGTSGAVDNWAPSLVSEAHHRIDAARSAWNERQDRLVATQSNEQTRSIRIGEAKASAGDALLELCGRPADLLPEEVLEDWDVVHGAPFNPNDCYLDLTRSACAPDPSAYLELVSEPQVRYAVCVFRKVHGDLAGEIRLAGGALDAFAASCAPEDVRLDKSGCSATGGAPCVSCAGNAGSAVALSEGLFLTLSVRNSVPVDLMRAAELDCQASIEGVQLPLPGPRDLAIDPPASCYRGALGEQALAMQSISKEIDIARTELEEFEESYDIAMQSCILRKEANDTVAALQEAHDAEMKTLRTVKLAADVAANAAGAVKDCAGAVAGATAPWDKGAAAVGCGAAAVEAAALSVSAGMEFAMAEAEAAHQRKLASVEAQAEYDICKNDARHSLVGVRSQALRIQQALLDLSTARVAFANLQSQAQLRWDDGLASVAEEESRTSSPLAGEMWLDEKVESYERSFRLAQRVMYLAVRAVEYEFQQSLAARAAVLTAEVPADLDAALLELRSYTGPRTVGGSRPTTKRAIVSLKRELLRLLDHSQLPATELRLTDTERLRLLLRSPKLAVYDDKGRYLGQQVPFTLAPLGLGNEPGIEIYSQDSCGERLWSVNASVLGKDDLVRGEPSTFTNLVILKSNTFFSQQCGDLDPEASFQVASVRPERNLFRDPVAGTAGFVDAALGRPTDLLMSKALVQPLLNVTRADFEGDTYASGASSQLAARGLFGEYALFFPAQILSRRAATGELTDGLDLTEVEDILLRFDYVTVAR